MPFSAIHSQCGATALRSSSSRGNIDFTDNQLQHVRVLVGIAGDLIKQPAGVDAGHGIFHVRFSPALLEFIANGHDRRLLSSGRISSRDSKILQKLCCWAR